ncbi:MAG: JmjC domain-containing protein, partial [Endozoicomonas sp.]
MKQSILGNLSPEQFLQQYWQKKPLLIRQAFPDYHSPVSPDELAGLALEEEMESRIILEHGKTPWELRNGPFSASDFSNLPDSHWTLLVQGVDHWVPEIRELFEHFTFLPSWRLDDIMVSYATDGGSVGPHYDQYDVFLLQTEGRRRWQIGQNYDESAPRIQGTDLHILSEFDVVEEHILEPGDMLYLPPGIGHHGTAEGECMTFSVGFRAPSHKEILMHFTDFLADQLPEHLRYSDPDQEEVKSTGEIDDRAIDRLQVILQQYLGNRELIDQWFGEQMTQPKYSQQSEDACQNWDELLEGYSDCYLLVEAGARFAYRDAGQGFRLFADGESYLCPSDETRMLGQRLCQSHGLTPDEWQALSEEESRQLILCLFNNGSLYLDN